VEKRKKEEEERKREKKHGGGVEPSREKNRDRYAVPALPPKDI
jgi:hypothetical protein